MSELTTLQLARKIADAVYLSLHPRGAGPNRSPDDVKDPPTQAVLRTLHENASWFCRVTGDDGEEEDGERYEPVQQGLFEEAS